MAKEILRKNKVGAGVHWEVDEQREQITQLKADLATAQDNYQTALDEWNDWIERGKQLKADLKELQEASKTMVRLYKKSEVKLKADRDKYKHFYEKKSKFLKTTLKRLDESSWENEQELKADLAKFGGHTAECAILSSTQAGMLGLEGPVPCDCGWAEVEKGQGVSDGQG